MKCRIDISIIMIFVQILLTILLFIIPISKCCPDLPFEIIETGDISGYILETYFVARTEEQWAEILKNHSAPFVYPEQWVEFWENRSGPINRIECREVNFSENMMICAFMGERRTAGYSIVVDRVWVDEEKIHVEIMKSAPEDEDVVATVLTYPYVLASIERSKMDVVFEVIGEDGIREEVVISEFFSLTNIIAMFAIMAITAVVLTRSDILKKPRVH